MSKKALSFPNFIQSLKPLHNFPKQQIVQYMQNTQPSLEQCLQLVQEYLHLYQSDCGFYKQTAVVIWGCLFTQLHRQIIQRGLSFFQSLLQTRLLMLIFDGQNKFVLDQVFIFLDEPLDFTVRKTLELGMAGRLMELFKRNNKPSSKTNQILFLFELLIIKKIKKYLDQQSTHQFMEFLKKTLCRSKFDLANSQSDLLKFKMTAILRENDQSSQTFALQCKDRKLYKVPQRGHLPQWVVDAYVNRPLNLDLSLFKQKNVLNVMSFLQYAQIYASSPKIQEFDEDQEFISFFSNYLQGAHLGDGVYKFGTEGARQTIYFLKQRLAKQEQCYHETIIMQSFGNKFELKKA